MTATSVAKKLVGGAVGVLAAAGAGVVHLAWYIRYQAQGTTREGEDSKA